MSVAKRLEKTIETKLNKLCRMYERDEALQIDMLLDLYHSFKLNPTKYETYKHALENITYLYQERLRSSGM